MNFLWTALEEEEEEELKSNWLQIWEEEIRPQICLKQNQFYRLRLPYYSIPVSDGGANVGKSRLN